MAANTLYVFAHALLFRIEDFEKRIRISQRNARIRGQLERPVKQREHIILMSYTHDSFSPEERSKVTKNCLLRIWVKARRWFVLEKKSLANGTREPIRSQAHTIKITSRPLKTALAS